MSENSTRILDSKEFDSIAQTYNDSLESVVGKNTERFAEYKIQLLHHIIKADIHSILDFGCGIGRSIEYFERYFADSAPNLFGCDTSPESIDIARKNYIKGTFFVNSVPEEFCKINERWDLVFLACVFHHIPPTERQDWTNAIIDRITTNGYLAVFEHNLLNPFTKRIVRSPENTFDQEDWMLSHNELLELLTYNHPEVQVYWDGYVLFSPVRFKWSSAFETIFRKIPIGAQHCVIVKKQ